MTACFRSKDFTLLCSLLALAGDWQGQLGVVTLAVASSPSSLDWRSSPSPSSSARSEGTKRLQAILKKA